MRAVCFTGVGGPDVVEVGEVPEPPAPTRDQLLVRLRASSINGTDLGLRRGGMRLMTAGRRPFVPGFDLASEVVACGPEVTAFARGDEVVALWTGPGGELAGVVTRPYSTTWCWRQLRLPGDLPR